jgi:hypothetical protein
VSTAKRDNSRSTRRGSKSEQPPASRRGREHWIVRWIGAKRRMPKPIIEVAIEAPSARIIPLSWADTFGRAACTEPTGTILRLPL